MATVTGTLNDVSLGHLVGKAPELVFTLSEPATSPAGLFVTDPVVATPNGSGSFTVSLEPTLTMAQNRHYRLAIRWLDLAGNYISVDYPDWTLLVPPEGGSISDLIDNFTRNPLMVFASPTEPSPWPVGTWWLDTSIDTPTSGDLYRMDR